MTVTGDATKTITLTDSANNSVSAIFTDNTTTGATQSRFINSDLQVDYGTFSLTTQSGTTPSGELRLIRDDNTSLDIDITPIVPTGLIKADIDNIGFVLAGIDRGIKTTTLGNKAIDMTTTVVGGVTDFGASGAASVAIGSLALSQGDFSISIGQGSKSIGNTSTALGWRATANERNSTAIGTGHSNGLYSLSLGTYINGSSNSESNGESSTAIGFFAKANGDRSVAIAKGIANGEESISIGERVTSFSYRETTIGILNEDYIPTSTSSFDENDKLFVVGNGQRIGNQDVKSNAFEIFKNGACVFKPINEPNNPEAGMLYFDQNTNKLRCHDGTTWQDLF